MIKGFDSLIQGINIKQIQHELQGLSFREILKLAKNKNMTALYWIYYLSRDVLAKAFFKYFLGDKKYWKRRLEAGDDYVFAAECFEMLASPTGPLFAFNPDVFSSDEKIIDRAKYYIYRYAQALAFKILRERLLGGLSGNIPKNIDKENLVTSYEAYLENSDLLASSDSFTDDIEIREVFAKFLVFLQKNYPKLYPLMLDRIRGLSYKEIAQKTSKTEQSVFMNVKKAYDLYKDFIGVY